MSSCNWFMYCTSRNPFSISKVYDQSLRKKIVAQLWIWAFSIFMCRQSQCSEAIKWGGKWKLAVLTRDEKIDVPFCKGNLLEAFCQCKRQEHKVYCMGSSSSRHLHISLERFTWASSHEMAITSMQRCRTAGVCHWAIPCLMYILSVKENLNVKRSKQSDLSSACSFAAFLQCA